MTPVAASQDGNNAQSAQLEMYLQGVSVLFVTFRHSLKTQYSAAKSCSEDEVKKMQK